MPTLAGPPLRKVTLNLYEDDCQILEHVFGYGWTTHVRDVVSADANKRRQMIARAQKQTLGDLPNGD